MGQDFLVIQYAYSNIYDEYNINNNYNNKNNMASLTARTPRLPTTSSAWAPSLKPRKVKPNENCKHI